MKTGFKQFLLLWGTSLVSATGSGMTSFALGIYIFQETGLASLTGLLILLGFLPGLLLTPFAGILADRIDRRLLMMLGDGLSILGLVVILFSIFFLDSKQQIWGIGSGVAISSVFSSFVEPAFRATISDLLDKEDFSRASGLVQLVSSARYLLSPILAGSILSFTSIHIILIIDMLTIVLTLPVTHLVRKKMIVQSEQENHSIQEDFHFAFQLLYQKKGVWLLVLFGILVSFCLGVVQTLMGPIVLAYADARFLGFLTTFSSCGMVAAGLLLGKYKIRKQFVSVLSVSLLLVGIAMIGFFIRENRSLTCFFGFSLFASLTFCNTALDYLVRTNLPNQHQGKVWGLIGIISQAGYVVAYASIGLIADYLIKPLLMKNGPLAPSLGKLIGVGPGRGAAFTVILAGLLLIATSFFFSQNYHIKELEDVHALETR